MEIVNLILVKGSEDKANRAQQSSPVEFDPFQPGRRPLPPNSPGPQYKAMKQWKAPRVIMTHLKEEMMPSQIYQGKGKASHSLLCSDIMYYSFLTWRCPSLIGWCVAFPFPLLLKRK